MENYINRRLQLNSIIWIEIIICFLINFVDYWFNSNKWCANPFSKSVDKCCSPSFMFCKYFFSFHSQHFIYITLFIGRGIFCIWAIKPNLVSVKCTRPYLQNWNVLCNRKVNFNTDKNLYINDYTNETKRIKHSMKNIISVLTLKIGNLPGTDHGKPMDSNKTSIYCMRKIIVPWH